MKRKLLICINALIALLLGILGVSCGTGTTGIPEDMYGVPFATFEAQGVVTDESGKPLEDIQVVVKYPRFYEYIEDRRKNDPTPFDPFTDWAPHGYTNADGTYQIDTELAYSSESIELLVRDTAGIYAPDSARLKVEYDRSKASGWNFGSSSVHQDFQLKKK